MASDAESVLKLGIQTDILKKSSAVLYMARHQNEVVRKGGKGAEALIWLFQRSVPIRKPKNNVRGICQ